MILFYVFIILSSIFLAAFFSGSEIGLVSLDRSELKKLADNGFPRAKSLRELTSEPERFITTLLVGTNLAIVTTSSFAATLSVLVAATWGIRPGVADILLGTVSSVLLLIFGEIIPKILFSHNPLRLSLRFSSLLVIFDKLFSPVVRIITWVSRLLEKNPSATHARGHLNREELLTMFKYAPEVVTAEEKGNFIQNVFDLRDLKCREILISRVYLEGLPRSATYDQILDFVEEHGFTRIPIYEDNLDRIIGILSVKDLLSNYHDHEWQQYIQKAFFVPENKKVLDLLAEMKHSGEHFAVVFDEYGG
ncbi:MAG: hypothetical protein CVU88_07125, partial [Firmicutes bacterium HGW-Firmicutes-13]